MIPRAMLKWGTALLITLVIVAGSTSAPSALARSGAWSAAADEHPPGEFSPPASGTYLPFIAHSTANKPVRVAVVVASAIDDASFSQSMWSALQSIQEEMGGTSAVELKYTANQSRVPEAASIIRAYASQGFDIVIAHDSQYGSSVQEIAQDFPRTVFAWGAGTNTFGLNNVYAYTAAAQEGGYVNGVMAAKLSRSKQIGVINPFEEGDAKTYVDGFVQGVASVDPNIRVAKIWTRSYFDVTLMIEAARSLIAAGADVLTGSAPASVGAIHAAEQMNRALWFGTQQDQAFLAPQVVVASQQYDWAGILRQMTANRTSGKLGGDALVITLKNGGLKIMYSPAYDLPADVKAAAESAIQGIKNGSIVVQP